jgi:hypothetical protein
LAYSLEGEVTFDAVFLSGMFCTRAAPLAFGAALRISQLEAPPSRKFIGTMTLACATRVGFMLPRSPIALPGFEILVV